MNVSHGRCVIGFAESGGLQDETRAMAGVWARTDPGDRDGGATAVACKLLGQPATDGEGEMRNVGPDENG